MITLTLDGKKVQCPGCYAELTTGTYQRAIREWDPDKDLPDRDFFKLFSILTGTDFKIDPTSENEVTVWNTVHWYVTEPFRFSTVLPSTIKIGDKMLAVPRKAGALSIGQNIHLRYVIEGAKYMEECLSMATAICLQPLYDGAKFDIERARELEKIIDGMPVYLIHPIGFFFLQTVGSPGRRQTKTSNRRLGSLGRSLRKMWPTWRRFRNSGSLTTWP